MAESPVILNKETVAGGDSIACDEIAGIKYQQIKQVYGGAGVAVDAEQPLTEAQLTAQGLATQATLELIRVLLAAGLDVTVTNAGAITISGNVAVSNFPASQAVTGTFFQATQPVSGTFFQATQPVSIASMPSTPVTGTFFQATQPISIADAANIVEGALADAMVAAGASGSISAKLRRATQGLEDLKTLIVLAGGANIIGRVGIDQTTPGTTNRVSLSTDVVNTKETRSTTGTGSTASISASATALASNANRLGATIYNESGGACRIKLGSTASATDYSVIIQIDGYYEIPFGYTGIITGIAVSGTALLRITELT